MQEPSCSFPSSKTWDTPRTLLSGARGAPGKHLTLQLPLHHWCDETSPTAYGVSRSLWLFVLNYRGREVLGNPTGMCHRKRIPAALQLRELRIRLMYPIRFDHASCNATARRAAQPTPADKSYVPTCAMNLIWPSLSCLQRLRLAS